MDKKNSLLTRYAQLLQDYVSMRQQLVDLLRAMDEEEVSKGTGAKRTASDLLDMAFDYLDQAHGELETVDKLLIAAQPLFFGHSLLADGGVETDSDLDDLRDLLRGLNLDLE